MPIDILTRVFYEGAEVIPGWDNIKRYGPILLGLGGIKYYCGGAINTAERNVHGQVYIITGATSGIGASIASELASKGAQIILLVRSTEDSWIVDHVEDLREKTNNTLIYAEECDLSSLYSVRKFATKWLDNSPPRRLDGVICCAADCIPIGKSRQTTIDGVERQIGINYLAHFHLLNLLSPSLRVQPPDRDVRVVMASCSSQALGDVDLDDILWADKKYPSRQPWKLYGSSKLMLGLFAKEFQKRIDQYERKDKTPCNVKINLVNPGLMNSASTRRFLSMGSIFGLLVYLILFPIWFLFLKTSSQGAQSFYFAISERVLSQMEGGNMIQECKIQKILRKEYEDEALQDSLFSKTEELIEKLEKQSAIERKKQEKLEQSKKPLAQRLKEKQEAKERKANLHEKPKTEEELQMKLNALKNSIGIQSSSVQELPLFPEAQVKPRVTPSSRKTKSLK